MNSVKYSCEDCGVALNETNYCYDFKENVRMGEQFHYCFSCCECVGCASNQCENCYCILNASNDICGTALCVECCADEGCEECITQKQEDDMDYCPDCDQKKPSKDMCEVRCKECCICDDCDPEPEVVIETKPVVCIVIGKTIKVKVSCLKNKCPCLITDKKC